MSLAHISLAVLATLIWGFNFVVVKVGLGSYPPLLFSALRFSVAFFPAVLWVKRNKVPWRWIVTIGWVMGVAVYSLIFVGLYLGASASASSVIVQIHVIFTLILSAIILRDRPPVWQWIGTFIAMIGIVMLMVDAGQHGTIIGLILVLGSALAWAVSTILLKMAGPVNMLSLMVWMCLIPPLPLLGLSLLFEKGQWQALQHTTLLGVGAIIYTGILSTVVAFWIWGKLISAYSPKVVAPFALLAPPFAMMASTLLLGERLDGIKIVAIALVLAGLLLVLLQHRLVAWLQHEPKPLISQEVLFNYFKM